MDYKMRTILYQILLVAVFVILTGCEAPFFKSEPDIQSQPVNKKLVAKPRRVIQGGMGLSFEITPEQATAMGFLEVSGCKYKKIAKDDPFWFLKEIHFTNLTCTVASFRAVKYYRDEDALTRETQCHEDKNLILDIIKEKYPTLVNVKWLPDSTHLCEGMVESSKGQLWEKGLGRCITLNCSDLEALEAYGLNVEYLDLDNMKLGVSEREETIKNNRDLLMRNKNIDPGQF